MNCIKCGAKLPEGAKFCGKCGAKVQDGQKKPGKSWSVLVNVGNGLGIAGLALFWFPILGVSLSITALVFGVLGKNDPSIHEKQQKVFKMGLAGTILGVLVLITLIIVIPVIAAKGII